MEDGGEKIEERKDGEGNEKGLRNEEEKGRKNGGDGGNKKKGRGIVEKWSKNNGRKKYKRKREWGRKLMKERGEKLRDNISEECGYKRIRKGNERGKNEKNREVDIVIEIIERDKIEKKNGEWGWEKGERKRNDDERGWRERGDENGKRDKKEKKDEKNKI